MARATFTALTVGELVQALGRLDADLPVVFGHQTASATAGDPSLYPVDGCEVVELRDDTAVRLSPWNQPALRPDGTRR